MMRARRCNELMVDSRNRPADEARGKRLGHLVDEAEQPPQRLAGDDDRDQIRVRLQAGPQRLLGDAVDLPPLIVLIGVVIYVFATSSSNGSAVTSAGRASRSAWTKDT